MQVKYIITKKLQLFLASQNKDAGRERTDYLENEDVAYIIQQNDRVEIASDGKVSIDLTHQLASVTHRILYADKGAGWAAGNVSYRQYYIHDKGVTSEGSTPEFNFLIDSKATLEKALLQINSAEDLATADKDLKSKGELEKLPGRVREYNERKEEREVIRKDERLAYLLKQVSGLREENEELTSELNEFRSVQTAAEKEGDEQAEKDDQYSEYYGD